jgi:RNA polymerase sigma factor (sigma-70 family)
MKTSDGRYYPNDEDLHFEALSPEDELALARKVRAGDAAARELFITRHLLYALKLGRRFCASRLPVDETTSAANEALMTAVDRFNPELGFRFRSFLVPYVRAAVARCWRARSPVDFKKGTPPVEVPLDAMDEGTRGQSNSSRTPPELVEHSTIEQNDHDGFLRGELAACSEDLTSREMAVVRLHYVEGFNLAEIGKKLNLSRERVRQIHDGILAGLRTKLEKRGVKGRA